MSASDAIVELEGEEAAPAGRERRRGMDVAFVFCLAVGSALVGRDGPAATAPAVSPSNLTLVYDRTGSRLLARDDVVKLGAGNVVFPDASSMIRVQLPEGAIQFVRRSSESVRLLNSPLIER